MNFRVLLLVGTALASSCGPALAKAAPPAPPATSAGQTPPAPQAPPSSQDAAPAGEEGAAKLEDVVVQSLTTDVRTSIDSISYSLADDLQAQTGTLADALRNVPSVDVDPQGVVSLRGDSNVTILVDGRPSGIFSGEGAAQAIQSLPADRYARIEVMTNPSAAHSPEGSGGIINLITKPSTGRPDAVTTGSVRVNVGNGGRWNFGLSGSRQVDRLTLSGDLGHRHDTIAPISDLVREQVDPATGAVVETTHQTQETENDIDVQFGRLTAEYRLSDKLQLTGELRGNLVETGSRGRQSYETRNAAGVPVGAFTRDQNTNGEGENFGTTGRIVRLFDDQGHEWTSELRLDVKDGHLFQTSSSDFDLPPGPMIFERTENRNSETKVGFTSAYVRPMSNGARLRSGYELEVVDLTFDNATSRGPAPDALVPDPFVTNRLEASRAVHALYTTYERSWNDLSAQFGLRLEYADLELDQITTGVTTGQDYFRAYPTLHVGYQLTDEQLVRASYSRRIQRPHPAQMNPFTVYLDPLNLRSGNPDLEPQETDSFEAMWQRRSGPTFYQATAYYRDTDKAFTDVATDIGGGVLLIRPENLGSRRDYGIELVANGQLHPTLRYNASVNVFRQELDAVGVAGLTDRSGNVATGRLTLNWQPTPDDFVQFSAVHMSKSLMPQGRLEPSAPLLNLGYRRKLTRDLAFLVTVRDLLDEFGNTQVYDTSEFRERTEKSFRGRAFYLGLSWNFGSGPRREQPPQFDFSPPGEGG